MLITIDDLMRQIERYNAEEMRKIYEAYLLAEKLHAGTTRESGDPYITHPVAVAYTLALMEADRDTIIACLLHDAIEDTDLSKPDIKLLFNIDVANMVDGVTKMRKLDYSSSEEAEIATVRKIILGMMEDPRILYIKLADRLHNMQTLQFKKNILRRKGFALETLDYFSPLAYSIGAYDMKVELEDLSFMFAMPDEYQSLFAKRSVIVDYGNNLLQEMLQTINKSLLDEGIPNNIKIKIKNIYRLYQETQINSKLSEIDNLMAMQVVVNNIRDCYTTLGVIHNSKYKPLDGCFRDFIAEPKPNLYQSIHTTVSGPRSKMVQMQIRDSRMDRLASNGLGAYWSLYQGRARDEMANDFANKMPFYGAILDIDSFYANNGDFVNQIRNEVFANYIYVETASGEMIELPVGSTALDFAYKIHSDLGNNFVSAIVGNEFVPIDYVLKNKDRVRIFTDAPGSGPDESWLEIAKTARAKQKIKRYLNKMDSQE